MVQQTAVEWLDRWFRDNYEATYEEGNKAFEQAKQMEKEQIKESWNDGNLLGRNGNVLLEYNTGEQYYNETYGKKISND